VGLRDRRNDADVVATTADVRLSCSAARRPETTGLFILQMWDCWYSRQPERVLGSICAD